MIPAEARRAPRSEQGDFITPARLKLSLIKKEVLYTVLILSERIEPELLVTIEPVTFFNDMIKCVVDIDREMIAVNANLHSDLEQLLLQNGAKQTSLYGINILFDEWDIEYDSLINPPRNREAGYPRVGRYVADPAARKRIEEVVRKWINL